MITDFLVADLMFFELTKSVKIVICCGYIYIYIELIKSRNAEKSRAICWISTEIANPSLVGHSIVSSLMYTTFVLTRALDAKHISDERSIHSFICAVHQTAFSPMYRLVHLHPTHDADHDG